MANSANVDERVIQMRMDNDQFEKGAEKTITTLEKLKGSINDFEKSGNTSGSGLNFLSPIEKGIDKIADKFSALQIAGKRAIENLTDDAINLAKQAITGADQIGPGYDKYEQQIKSIQKLMIATGESMETVQDMSDRILTFTDETSYHYDSLLSTISSFTSSGYGIQQSMDTVIGMAVAAGQAGTSAEEAAHAFNGFQKAVAQGKMSSSTWQWIKTAGMNTAEIKQNLLDAAVAVGSLEKGSNGAYYALEQTAKGVKKTEVTLSNFDTTFAADWLTSEAIIKGMSKYATAYNQIYDIHKRDGAEIFEIIDAQSQYINQLDQYSLAAFKAGQETKTFRESVEAIKTAVSSGWMKSFELIIGNYKQAAGFWTELIEPLWNIFVEPGKGRNEFLEAAFGGESTKSTVANWDKLVGKLKEAGKTTDDLEKAFNSVVGKTQDAQVKSLASEYGSLEEAIKRGAVTGEQLKEILNEINGITTSGAKQASVEVEEATQTFADYRKVALGVLRGDYGNGGARKKKLAEMGYDYDTIQWLAGNMQWLHQNGWSYDKISDEYLKSLPKFQHVQEVIDSLGKTSKKTAQEVTGSFIDINDVTDEFLAKADQMSGRELWQASVINIVNKLAEAFGALGEAFDEVFGDAKSRGEGLRGWLVRLYELAEGAELSGEALMGIKDIGIRVFSAIKNGFGGITKTIKSVWKLFKALSGVVLDLFGWLKNIFSGGLKLPEQLEGVGGILGKVLQFVSDIISKINDFTSKNTIWDLIDKAASKVEELRSYFKEGGKIGGLFKSLFGSEKDGEEATGFLGKFGKFFDQFQQDTDNISRSIDDVGGSVNILSSVLGGVGDVMSTLYEGIFGDPEKFREKISTFWENFKGFFVDEYGKINWDTLFDVGRLGLVGVIIYRIEETFKTLKKYFGNSPGSILGILNNFANRISSPLASLSKAIENHEKSNRYLKIAAAIALLASSIYLLTKVDEQKFFNVAVTLGFLMAIMAKMAKNAEGFSLFSNNNKTIAKNNPITNTVKAFESLQKLFTFDFSGATANISLLPKTMGTLLGVASVIISVVYAILKLKDVAKPGELEQLIPTFIIIGSIIAVMAGVTAILAAVTKDSKYIGKAGGAMLAMAASIYLIVNMITKIGKMSRMDLDWTAMLVMFGMIVGLLLAMALVISAAGKLTNQGQSAITSGSAVWGVMGVILAIAVTTRSLVKSMAKASEIQNLTKGVVLLAALFLGLIVVFTIMSAIVSSNKTEPSAMLKMATSMVILAAAIAIMVPAIMLMSALPAKGLLAAAAAIAILVISLAAVVFMMNSLDPKAMLVTAAVFAVISLSMATLIGTIGLLTIGMLTLIATVPWDTLQDKFENFKKAMDTITPTLLSISVIVMIFGLGMLAAAIGAGVFGLSFLVVAAGAYLAAAAFAKLVEALNGLTRLLPNLMQGLVDTANIFAKDWWKIILVVGGVVAVLLLLKSAFKGLDFSGVKSKAGDLAESIPKTIEKLVGAIKLASPQIINGMLHLGILAITALALMVPFAITKLVNIIVSVVSSLAAALDANSGALIAAFEQMVGVLIKIFLKALANLSGDFLGFINELILGLVRSLPVPGADKVADWLSKWLTPDASQMEAAVNKFDGMVDAAFDKTFGSKNVAVPVSVDPKADLEAITNDPSYQAAMEAYSSDYTASMGETGTQGGQILGNNTTSAFISTLTGGQTDIGGTVMDVITGGVDGTDTSGASDSVTGMLGEVFGGGDVTSQLQDLSEGEGTTWVNGLTGSVTSGDSTTGLQNAATSAFNIFGNQFNTSSEEGTPGLGSSIISGLYNAIIAKAQELLPDAGAFAFNQVASGVESAGDINSPSREMAKEGYWMILGLAQGLDQSSDIAYKAGTEVGNGLINEFQSTMQRVAMIANDDLTITPTITPVVDLRNVNSASGAVSTAFSQGYSMQAEMTGSINRRMNEVERVATNMKAATQTVNNGDVYTINVYPSQGMDEEALADAVMAKMQTRMVRRSAAFG